MHAFRRTARTSGFALLEVLIASAIVITIAAGASLVAALAIRATQQARMRTLAMMLAVQRMEQLRSLAWTHITTASPALSMSSSDVTTDLSRDPATDAGPGLLLSPAGTLDANVAGYVDYLDGSGRWVGNGPVPPSAAVYVRRWSVAAGVSDPDDLLALTVVVGMRGASRVALSDAVRLITLESRK
jgi:type II secretory pathway pseudopilin PulG